MPLMRILRVRKGPSEITRSDTDYDTWMHFKYPHEAKMKHEADFKEAWVADGAASMGLAPG